MENHFFNQVRNRILVNVDRVNGFTKLVKTEQLDEVGVHPVGLVDHQTQALKSDCIALLPHLYCNFFKTADLNIERVLHVVNRRCDEIGKADVLLFHAVVLVFPILENQTLHCLCAQYRT